MEFTNSQHKVVHFYLKYFQIWVAAAGFFRQNPTVEFVKTNHRSYYNFKNFTCEKPEFWTESYYSSALCYWGKTLSKKCIFLKFSELFWLQIMENRVKYRKNKTFWSNLKRKKAPLSPLITWRLFPCGRGFRRPPRCGFFQALSSRAMLTGTVMTVTALHWECLQ